jgi:hypothetical protein
MSELKPEKKRKKAHEKFLVDHVPPSPEARLNRIAYVLDGVSATPIVAPHYSSKCIMEADDE